MATAGAFAATAPNTSKWHLLVPWSPKLTEKQNSKTAPDKPIPKKVPDQIKF